jgi:2-phosphoglycerate kinase/FMN phosphatase YigB (HAD superfamily)
MVETQILSAIRLLSNARETQDDLQNPKDLLHDYLCQKRQEKQRPLTSLAQAIEQILRHSQVEITLANIEALFNNLETLEREQPTYQYRDPNRLENLQGYLHLLKNGSPDLRLKALERVEQILCRIHNTYAIAWDFGGVLMDGHNKFFVELYAYAKGANLTKEQLLGLWDIIFKSDPIPGVNYDALKIGQATPEQFASHAIAHFNRVFAEAGKEPVEISDREIQSFLTLYYSHYDAKHENREVLHRLHQLGLRQYGLTNNFMAKIEYFLEQNEFDYLQRLIKIVSEKFRASKPDSRIYLSFKQHVFIDRFAKEILQVDLPDRVLDRLWQALFQDVGEAVDNFAAYEQQQASREQVSRYAIEQYNYAIEQYNKVFAELGCPPVDVATFADRWLEFWENYYENIAEQTIFIDDKVKNLDRAFQCEGILGVHYDANQGQKVAEQPIIRELLEQEHLKESVRTLRELTAAPNPVSQRAKQALERLMPFRIRHEKLVWQAQFTKHQNIIDALSEEQIYALLQHHYVPLYTTHYKLGQLVSHQYALIHRLAILPEYTYDEARQIVLELFETSALFLDQNHDLYPWQDAEMPEEIATELGDIQENESILKKKLLPEIKRKIVEYIDVLDVSHQPSIQHLLGQLQTEANDLETLKHLTGELLQQLAVLQSVRVVPWQQIDQFFQDMRETLALGLERSLGLQETRSFLSSQLEEWYQQFEREAQQTAIDLMPLQRVVSEWEQEIHQLESAYFQRYHRWKTLKEQEEVALYQDALLDGVRDQFSQEELYQFMRGLMLRVYDLPRWKDLTKPTVILVSGASGSGKSTLSTHLARIFGIQKVFSTDEAGRANTQAILDFLFGEEEATQAFPDFYQSSFEGNLESYYYQAMLTAIGVEGLAKRLHKQNTSALLEGVGLLPGLLSKPIFELLNLDWLVVQVDPQQHYQNFAHRSRTAAKRNAQRYLDRFETIRDIHDRIISLGLEHELTIVENKGPLQEAIRMATERIKGPLTSQFIEVRDPLREQIRDYLGMQRQHLPVQIRFDVKRAALNLGLPESTIVELLHRFGFEAVPHRRHQWIRQQG